MAIPSGFIQDLLTRTDVVEVVGRYVKLKKAGANFSGLCPFHNEKSPSFTVSPSKQFYHCFGCGKNGDAINFLMEHNGLNFVEAVQELAQQCGLQVPEEDHNPQAQAQKKARLHKQKTIVDYLEQAAKSYQQQLKNTPHAIEYLKQRGITGEIAAHFGLGFAPASWQFLESVFTDYTNPLLQESGLVAVSDNPPHNDTAQQATPARRYDRFRARVMFPIRNIQGQCIGFGGRVLGDEKPKYLNSPETPVFNKSYELYGLFEARQAIREHGFALVTEGYMDVVALAQLGFANTVATLGTACTNEHIRKLFRFTSHVVFSFDGDAAGQRAAHKALAAALPYANDTRSIHFLFLPPEHDPDSYIRSHGAEAFKTQIDSATPLSRFLIEAASDQCNIDTTEGRAKLSSQAAPLWNALPDGVFKHQLLGELAQLVRLPKDELHTLWHSSQPKQQAYQPTAPISPKPALAARPATAAYHRQITPTAVHSHADHIARYLLGDMSAWDNLSPAEHTILAQQPHPHGTLFNWLETQNLEHGTQAWSVLRIALHNQPQPDITNLAMRLMQSDHRLVDLDHAEFIQNIRALQIKQLQQQLTTAYAHSDIAQAQRISKHIAQLQQTQANKPAAPKK